MQGRFNTTPVFICYFYLALSQSKFQFIVCYANAVVVGVDTADY